MVRQNPLLLCSNIWYTVRAEGKLSNRKKEIKINVNILLSQIEAGRKGAKSGRAIRKMSTCQGKSRGGGGKVGVAGCGSSRNRSKLGKTVAGHKGCGLKQ